MRWNESELVIALFTSFVSHDILSSSKSKWLIQVKISNDILEESNYLSFQHIANEEYHHTRVDFILYAPRKPSRYGLTKLTPDVILWHNN